MHFLLWTKGSHETTNFDTFKCWFAGSYELLVLTFTYLYSYFIFLDFVDIILIQWKKDAGTFKYALKSIKDKLRKSISGLQHDIWNIKNVIIQRLQEDNLKLKETVSWLEDKVVQLGIKNNSLEMYGRRNNLEIEGILTSISDDELEKTTVAILNSINVKLESSDGEACHRIGRSKDSKPKKTIIHIANWKLCKKALLNRKKLPSVSMIMKFS